MEIKPTSLILRFRDLSTPPGSTILEHKNLISKNGYVWWGWWSKIDERMPHEIIVSFNDIAQDKTLELFLFDSGQEKLYHVVCNGINWDKSFGKISSPEPEKTPKYYTDLQCLCWLKITNITEISQPEIVMNIHKLTYVKVDEFFIQPPSKYVDFYGKQISSLKELQAQPRTIWFTRPFITTDPTHEILLLDGQRLRPAHFPDSFQEKNSDKFLWVSDLHCSEKHSHFPKENSIAQKDFSTALKKSFDDNEIGDIAGVIVSGDITWQADPTEFSTASKIFSIIKSNANLNWYDFCICPGNHDIAFSDSPAEPSTPVKYSMDEARLSFDDHYKELFYLKPNSEISSGRKFLLGNLLPVEIAMFNSSLLQQEKGHFQGHGFIGDKQLDLVASSMGWDKNNTKSHGYRMAVVHHHVMPVSFRDIPAKDVGYSVLLDAEAFTRWVIEHRVDLVLHGHMHQPFHTSIGRLPTLDADLTAYHEFDVVGLGSSGVSLDHVGEVGRNTFAILDFTTGKCVIDIYSLDPINPSKKLYTISLPRDSS